MNDDATDSGSSNGEVCTIDGYVRHWARVSPKAIAVMSPDGEVLEYQDLRNIITELREELRNLGIRQNDRVGLLFAPGPMAITAFVSVASCAISAPLNHVYKRNEIEFFLQALRPRVLVIDTTLDATVRATANAIANEQGIPVIEMEPRGSAGRFSLNLDSFHVDRFSTAEQSPLSPTDIDRVAVPDDVALMLHTSGSTGQPKCVPLSHRAMCTGSRSTAESLGLTQHDRCLNLLAPCHVHGLVSNTVMPLVTGGSILATSGFRTDRIVEWLAKGQPTWISAPPSMQQQIAETWAASASEPPKSSLRFMRSGSVPLWPELIDFLSGTFGVPIVEAYGMTEVPHISGNPWAQCRSGSVGKPVVDNLAIMNSAGEVLPYENVGEIVVRGRNVTSGYLNAPEANADAFCDGWFHTGDLGWLDADGYLFLKGRHQETINRGGNKVMPREVEEALIGHPSVRRAVAFPVAHPSLGSDVVAAVVLTDGYLLDESGLRRFVAEQISDFKVPTRIIEVAEFPLEASGKINRALLEERLGPALRVEFEPPSNIVEIRLSQIWEEVLRQDRIGLLDNFFSLGGHSLLAARVMARVVSEFKVDLPLRSLFEFPTIKELSIEIAKYRSAGRESSRTSLRRLDRTWIDRLPLSFSQQRLWFLEQMEGELTAYNMPYGWRLRGRLDVEALRLALEAIVHRHEPLRTTFSTNDGVPVQVIGLCEPFRLLTEDLSSFNPDATEAKIAELCREAAEQPFDLTSDLMLRASVLRLADEEHLLLLTMHHIAFDGWSMRILWQEVATLYAGYCLGETPRLPELPVRYSDYAIWQRSELKEQRLAGLLDYWSRQLEGISPLELPTDRPRPPVPTHRGARQEFQLTSDLIDPLKRLALTEGVTLHMTLLAAFQALLARYSRQDDIAVATPTAGRNDRQLEEQIGFFVNTLVLRTDLSDAPTFRELLGRVREVSLAACDHQELPFEKLVEDLQPERHLSRSPLVQVLFQLMSFSEQQLILQDLEVACLPEISQRVVFDLELHLWQQPDNIRGSFVFSTDLFDPATITRMAEHFVTLLSGIVANPDVRLCELPMMTERERHQLLVEWNDTAADFPHDKCVHELFEQQASRTPDAVAVVFETQELTYRDLNQRANLLAHHLRNLDVGRETLVGLCLDRSPELVVGILGILKAGGAYVPLDADYPPERLQFMLDDAGLKFLVTQQTLLNRLPAADCQAVCLDTDTSKFQNSARSNPSPATEANNLAYVMFTSGSTGRPKGVQISHRAVVNLLTSMAAEPGLTSDDRLLSVTRPTFDISVLELLLPLSVGACVEVVSAELAADASGLCEKLRKAAPTVVQATPATWQMLIETGWEGCRDLKVLCGGEALTDALARKLSRRSGELWNMYGPTETTIWSTIHRVDSGGNRGVIGHPIANTQVYVLDAHGQPTPIGIAGELYIGGAGMAEGYLNRPDLTAEKFVTNPLNEDLDSRLYRTGDLCRWIDGGTLEFQGRLDNQVKLRGYRIELGEIEAALDEHDDVAQSVVILREDHPGDKRIVAYCVPNSDRDLSLSELKRHLRSGLPDYMLPAAFSTLAALPLTSSGKIDRRALRVPSETSKPSLSNDQPKDLLERRLLQIWQKLFDVKAIGREDNFFDLGGHSLLAVRLAAEIEKLLGWRLSIASIFQTPNIASLAEVLREKDGVAPPRTSLVPLQPDGSKLPFFFVHGWGGEVHVFESLARCLAPDQPVFGLRAIDPFGAKKRPVSVEEMAAQYVREIRSHQPEGPYYIGGSSLGGWIAYEIAQQLTRQSQAVRMLGIIDTGAVSTLPKLLYWRHVIPHLVKYLTKRCGLHLRRFLSLPWHDVIGFLQGRCSALRAVFFGHVRQPLSETETQTDSVLNQATVLKEDHYRMLVSLYQPEKYEGIIDLFASDPGYHRVPPVHLFQHFSRSGVRIHHIGGDHSTMLDEDHVENFAREFQRAIDAA